MLGENGDLADIEKAGLLTVRDNRVLLCRKRHGTALLILPGGRNEAGEDAMECLRRELAEELGPVRTTRLEFAGKYTSQAATAGEASPKRVQIDLYCGDLQGEPAANSEIRELVWFGQSDNPEQLAPSLRYVIFPDLIARGILTWTAFPETGRLI